MNTFFEEYSRTLLSILGGIVGINIIFDCFFYDGSQFPIILNLILEGLM